MALSSVSLTDSSVQANSIRKDTPARSDGNAKTSLESRDQIEQKSQNRDKVTIGSSDKEMEEVTYLPPGMKMQETEKSDNPSSINENEKQSEGDDETEDANEPTSISGDSEFSEEELQEISKLQARDNEVKAHEQAHIASGGQYVRGGAHFEYQTGPDGEKYAVGGEVSIDVSKESGDPQATISKMQVVIRAALAPANPSSQDRSVAAQATRIESEARAEAVSSGAYSKSTFKTRTDEEQSDSTSSESPSGNTPKIDLFA
ncbi:MAG: putative metalloprotease CJM1_0395 family protein [Desulfobacteraceae bacterium]|jgi:hypothetical protein